MKLYYTPGACSQASHIALHEARLPFEGIAVDLRAKKSGDGEDYLAVNPKGSVPAIALDDGAVLTENAAILQYIGDQAPASGLLPPLGHFERYRVLEWLNYIATELHKGFGLLWNPSSQPEAKEAARELLARKFDYVEQRLGDSAHLQGERFTAADAYLFVILSWTGMHQIDLSRWSRLASFVQRVSARPAVQETLRAEGLVQ